MTSNKEKRQHIIRTFEKKSKIQTLIIYLAMFCFAWALISLIYWDVSLTGLVSPRTEMWTVLGIAVVLLVFSYYYWRCPACNRFLRIRPGLKASLEQSRKATAKDWQQLLLPIGLVVLFVLLSVVYHLSVPSPLAAL